MAFYDDGNYRSKEEAKKRLTLDLNKVNSSKLKKPRFDVLLSSPDLNMLKLPSPELEKLIMQQNGLLSATPTPSQFLYPNPRIVTQDQELYCRGFDDALAVLHQNGAASAAVPSVAPSDAAPNADYHTSVVMETANNNGPHSNYVSHPPTSSSPFAGAQHSQVNIVVFMFL